MKFILKEINFKSIFIGIGIMLIALAMNFYAPNSQTTMLLDMGYNVYWALFFSLSVFPIILIYMYEALKKRKDVKRSREE